MINKENIFSKKKNKEKKYKNIDSKIKTKINKNLPALKKLQKMEAWRTLRDIKIKITKMHISEQREREKERWERHEMRWDSLIFMCFVAVYKSINIYTCIIPVKMTELFTSQLILLKRFE